jgi:hypothetical protein
MQAKKPLFKKPVQDTDTDKSVQDLILESKEQVQEENNLESNPVVAEQKEKTITLTLDELNALMDKKIQEAKDTFVQEAPKETKKKEEFIKLENNDDIPELEGFEYKNRRYEVSINPKSISQGVRNRSKKNSPLQYIHPVTKQPFSLRLSSNQSSFFEEKQSKELGSVKLRYINIIDGVLFVPASDIILQKFLHIHPDKGIVFKEIDENADALDKIEKMDLSFKAEELVRGLEFSAQDALARMICSTYKEGATASIIKNDLFVTVRNHANPALVIKYAEDDLLLLKGMAKTAKSRGYLSYVDYRFVDENNVVVLQVGREQDEWNAIAE